MLADVDGMRLQTQHVLYGHCKESATESRLSLWEKTHPGRCQQSSAQAADSTEKAFRFAGPLTDWDPFSVSLQYSCYPAHTVK